MAIIYRVLFLLLVFFSTKTNGFAQDITMVKNKDGISVYKERNAIHHLNRVIATTIIDENIQKILSLICDAKHHENWVYASHGAYILDSITAYHWIYYSITEAPWPLNNRDLVSSVNLIFDCHQQIIRIESIGKPNLIPQSPNMVRIPVLHSQWQLKKLDDKHTKVELKVLVDAGGNIPNWVINLFSTNGPYKTLMNMKTEVKKPRYQKANKIYQEILQDF